MTALNMLPMKNMSKNKMFRFSILETTSTIASLLTFCKRGKTLLNHLSFQKLEVPYFTINKCSYDLHFVLKALTENAHPNNWRLQVTVQNFQNPQTDKCSIQSPTIKNIVHQPNPKNQTYLQCRYQTPSPSPNWYSKQQNVSQQQLAKILSK